MLRIAQEVFGTVLLFIQPRMIAVAILGVTAGLPLALTGSVLTAWMTEAGVSLGSIGLIALVGLSYNFKFLWAPVIDQLPLPPLTTWLGRRRGWLIFCQMALMAAVVALGTADPLNHALLTAGLAVLVAFLSASQDIVIDAYRIERLSAAEQGVGASTYIYGYRVGMLISGGGALILADSLDWFWVYVAMAACVSVGVVTVLLSREPEGSAFADMPAGLTGGQQIGHWLSVAVVAPFREFTGRPTWAAILLFIVFYKFCDAFAGIMATPFYLQIGFSKTEIGVIAKGIGLAATLGGVFIGALMVARLNILLALLICGVLQGLSNLMFAYLATAGHDLGLLTLTIAVENLTGGMGTAVFVAYISQLAHINFTATQFSLLSSLAAVGRTVLSSGSGFAAEALDWIWFFALSTALAVPGLLILWWLMRQAPRPSDTAAD